MTFAYGVIFIFAMILNSLVNRLKNKSDRYVSCVEYLNAIRPNILKLSNIYSKTCLKRPLKNRHNTDLNDIW